MPAIACAAIVLGGCDSGGWVAKAGPYTLDVQQLSEIIVDWEYFPLREVEVEKWAHRWVEWTLFVDRLAEGDSLADSATVYYAVWPEVHELLLQGLRRVIADSVPISREIIDSVFRAGEYRMIYHILLRTQRDAGPAARRAVRAEMDQVRARLVAGGEWARENERNQDVTARSFGGSLGIITRGAMEPAFDSVAYALAPGEFSHVFETRYGFHVAWRPRLSEVREEFTEEYRQLEADLLDSAFEAQLLERYEVEFADDMNEIVIQAATDPLKSIASRKVIARYKDGGRFTVEDLIRRLRMEPPSARFDMRSGDPEFIREQLAKFLRRELTVVAALDYGVAITPELDAELRFGHKQNMADVIENMQLDRYLSEGASERERREAVMRSVYDHFRAVASEGRVPRFVPTYLSDILRRGETWRVSDRGVAAVVELVTQLEEQQ